MIDFNSYIKGLDLSRLTEYCVNHGQLTQYAKGDYFIKAGEKSRFIGFIECGYFNYIVHNSSEQKDYITGFAFDGEFSSDDYQPAWAAHPQDYADDQMGLSRCRADVDRIAVCRDS